MNEHAESYNEGVRVCARIVEEEINNSDDGMIDGTAILKHLRDQELPKEGWRDA